MITRKELVVVLLTLCISAVLFVTLPTRSQTSYEYDPWADVSGPIAGEPDGTIDMRDIAYEVMLFNTHGESVNRTSLLEAQSQIENLTTLVLELQARIDVLNTTIVELQSRIESLETMTPNKGYVSISPAAFTPRIDMPGVELQTYQKQPFSLLGSGHYYACPQLPHGVTLINMTVYLYDAHIDGMISVSLYGYNLTEHHPLGDPFGSMALVESSRTGSGGDYVLFNDTIAEPKIDNHNCIYSIDVTFEFNAPFSQLAFNGILIEYEYLP